MQDEKQSLFGLFYLAIQFNRICVLEIALSYNEDMVFSYTALRLILVSHN